MHVGYRKTSWTCGTCGLTVKCRPCVEEKRDEDRNKQRTYERAKRAALVAAGLTTKGMKPKKPGWASFRELDQQRETGVLDIECFEAPERITKRELEFLI